jgi:phosphopantetheinyl transferase
MLEKQILESFKVPYSGIQKNEFGKPFYKASNVSLSLSHSYPYVAAIADTEKSVGIDVEQMKPKLLKIASRVMHSQELADAGEDITKHCIYWCAKEAMLKVHGRKDLVFAEHLVVRPFNRADTGELHGKIIADGKETVLPLWYEVLTDAVVVFNT